MHCWGRARLSSHNSLPVSADVKRQDIVSVERLFGSVLVLRSHRYLLTAIELLCSRISIHDNAKRSNHVSSFALRGVPQILLAVSRPEAIDVLDLKFSLGCVLVRL